MNSVKKSIQYSLRFLLSCNGKSINLKQIQRIAMKPPPSDAELISDNISTFWYGLKDAEGRILYGRIIQNPLGSDFEITTGKEGEELNWQTASGVERLIVLIVPDLRNASVLVINGSEKSGEQIMTYSFELAKYSIK